MSSTTRLRNLLVALLATFALLAAACGGGDDEATSFDSDDSADTSEEAAVEDVADAAEDAMDEAEDAEDAMADDAMEESDEATDTVAPSERAAEGTEGESLAASPAASGGFFTDESPDAEADVDANFADYGIRSFIATDRDPLSTFALDVDTGAYSIARQWLESGQLPPRESVRVEEYVNSFNYDYPAPRDGLTVVADGGPSPYNRDNVILRLGVQAEEVSNSERPDAALTFVIDTSGSMDRPNRLGLVKEALIGLTRELDRNDSVAIVTYSDGGNVVLPPTSVANEDEIIDAIDRLRPNGSTNLESGAAARLRTGQRAICSRWSEPGDPGLRRHRQRRPYRP